MNLYRAVVPENGQTLGGISSAERSDKRKIASRTTLLTTHEVPTKAS